ncbi:MAG: hypothetical protein JOY96_10455 [Verrucomicrobia bacterium]|nr:hypothetical protein [Verrucomicrobiota bacterium]
MKRCSLILAAICAFGLLTQAQSQAGVFVQIGVPFGFYSPPAPFYGPVSYYRPGYYYGPYGYRYYARPYWRHRYWSRGHWCYR